MKLTIMESFEATEPYASRSVLGRIWKQTFSMLLAAACILFMTGKVSFADDSDKGKASKIPDAQAKAKEESKEEELNNWANVSFGGVAIDGDKAQFMRSHAMSRGLSGGVEDFHYEKELSKGTKVQLDGRGLFDAHDYFLSYKMEKEKLGSWNIGYKEFRTWYDGHGGFFPPNGQWIKLFDNELAVDRGEAWFEAELTIPDLPVLGFKYVYEFRNGQKDSLLWGDSNMTERRGARKIVPSLRDINERRDTFDFFLKHTIEETAFKVGLKYETTADNNRLYVTRNPGEATERAITTRETQSSQLFDFYGSTETQISEKVLLSSGYSLRTLDSDFGGSFIYGPGFDAPFQSNFPHRQANDTGFIDLDGGAEMRQAIVSLNTMVTPLPDLALISGVRAEHEDTGGTSRFIQTSIPATFMNGYDDLNFLNVSEKLEVRYTGVRDWAFYANALWEEGNGTIAEKLSNSMTGAITIMRQSELERWNQKYTMGVNWYPLSQLNTGVQYYHKINTRSYRHPLDNTVNTSGDTYPAFIMSQDTTTDDANLRVTWRPFNNLTSVSRYDFQYSTIDSRMDALSEIQTGRVTSHIWSETLTWNAFSRLYFQASGNVALNRTEVPVNGYSGAVLEAKNNYLTTSFTTGYALDKKTDLTATYNFYQAMDNYYDNSLVSVPYGSGGEEHNVILSMVRRISENIRWTAKYGFFRNRDMLYGGFTDYDAHMLYTGIQVAF